MKTVKQTFALKGECVKLFCEHHTTISVVIPHQSGIAQYWNHCAAH